MVIPDVVDEVEMYDRFVVFDSIGPSEQSAAEGATPEAAKEARPVITCFLTTSAYAHHPHQRTFLSRPSLLTTEEDDDDDEKRFLLPSSVAELVAAPSHGRRKHSQTALRGRCQGGSSHT